MSNTNTYRKVVEISSLHRLINPVDQARNREYAGKVCVDVWDPGGATPNLECDEYPFASTKEGAYLGSTAAGGDSNGWRTWNGSSRLIGAEDNGTAGTRYINAQFYQANRMLDDDAFFVAISR
ncbi:hypothetical protein Drose_15800 [Dactylosporangium roseum]|uniref:Deoxyribonuclease NucA/NucB domain-containing protein n=1 Tax=Dactylosporangium roseum TaxID=47989 RepID=A0ABY5ZI25_9ACTN|nr:hypothetical protein Drose_15800 [Dactylosporangium roseum]